MNEIERTFLAKYLPEDIESSPSKEIIDIYTPEEERHPNLRIRKNGEKYEITKKTPIDNDPSHQTEETIHLTKEEFESLSKVEGKKVHKIRYLYKINNLTAEIDVFQGDLKGLVVVDFEFTSLEEIDAFNPPEFCGPDVTHEEFIAGGMICGKMYADIEERLKKYDYKRL